MKVLIADDDLVSRLLLECALEALGYECLVAEDGEEAWRLFGSSNPDVVITDWAMPGMNGLELCRRIRGDLRASYTYVIVVTSLVDRADVRAGMEAGADDYLTKPLDPFDLETRLVAAKRVTSLHAELARLPRRAVLAGRHGPAHPAAQPALARLRPRCRPQPQRAVRARLLPGHVRRRLLQGLQRRQRAPGG